ncbi:MAG: hypothetical protein Q4D36_10190 [Bacteroidales bacterium]|nr:hypothetical protein [Bacteroidales bacterium]
MTVSLLSAFLRATGESEILNPLQGLIDGRYVTDLPEFAGETTIP